MPITQTEPEIKDKYIKFHETLTSCYYQPKGKRTGYPHPTEEEVNELELWAGQEIAEVRSPVETSIGLQQFNQIHGNIHSEMDGLLIAAGFLEPPPTPGPYIDTEEIVDGAVTEDKIPTDALTHLAVGPGAIRAEELATGAVTGPKIHDNAVTRGKIADGAVNRGKIDELAVNTGKLEDNAVKKIKIFKQSVDKEKLDPEIKYWKLERNAQVISKINLSYPGTTDVDVASAVSLSGITIPEGAVGVIMDVNLRDPAATPEFFVRKNGEAGDRFQHRLRMQVPNKRVDALMIVEMDKQHIIEWHFSGGSGAGIVQAKLWGWVIEPKS